MLRRVATKESNDRANHTRNITPCNYIRVIRPPHAQRVPRDPLQESHQEISSRLQSKPPENKRRTKQSPHQVPRLTVRPVRPVRPQRPTRSPKPPNNQPDHNKIAAQKPHRRLGPARPSLRCDSAISAGKSGPYRRYATPKAISITCLLNVSGPVATRGARSLFFPSV